MSDSTAGPLRIVVAEDEVAGLDDDRARDWVIVRMILNAHWAIEDADRASRPLRPADREWITTCITVAKAVID